MRKSLSECHTLTLSYVFLMSCQSKILSIMSSAEEDAVVKDLEIYSNLKTIEDATMLACLRCLQAMKQPSISEAEAEEKIVEIRCGCSSQEAETATKIISSLIGVLLNTNPKISESNLIIDVLRPLIKHCILSSLKDVDHEWMTYRMVADNNEAKIMSPDLAVYMNPISEM